MTSEEEEARDRLLFYLENETGFWFGMVVGDDARPRARLCEAAEAWCKEHGKAFVLHEPAPTGLIKLAVSLASGDSPGVHWIRADGMKGVIEAWNAGAAQMLMAMNERREAYRKRLDGGIVVEGRSALKRILREMAPDLFSIRAFIAEPGEEPRQRTSEFPEWRPLISLAWFSGIAPDTELALQQLARATAFEGMATTPDWMGAKHFATMSLIMAGRHDEAEPHAQELLTRAEKEATEHSDDAEAQRRLGGARSLLGMLFAARGNLEGALLHIDDALRSVEAWVTEDHVEAAARGLQLFMLGKLRAAALAASNQPDAARVALQQQVDVLTHVEPTGLHPEMRLELLTSLNSLGDISRQQGDFEAAERFLGKAVHVAETCATESPQEPRWQLELIKCRIRLGAALLQKRDATAAAEVLRPAVARVDRLESTHPATTSWASEVQPLYVLLSLCLSVQGDFSADALLIQERAYMHLNDEFDRRPEDVDLGWTLGHLCGYRAILLETAGNMPGARDAARRALDLVDRLPVHNEGQAQIKSLIEALRPFARKPRKKRRPAKP